MKTTFLIHGMHCASCAINIEHTLLKIAGVKSAEVNYALGRATVEFDENQIDEAKIFVAVKGLSYDAVSSKKTETSEEEAHDHMHKATKDSRSRAFRAIALSIPVFVSFP